MKKLLLVFSIAAIMAGLTTSCSSDDDVTSYYKLAVTAVLPENVTISDITSASVTVSNAQTGRTFTSEDIASEYSFEIPGGTYNVQVSLRSNDGGATTSYNAAKEVSVYDNTNVSLNLEAGTPGSLLFKEVYYNMVKPNGKTPYMRDQFFEIYNNSDEVLYLDNCVLGILEGSQGKLPTSWIDADGQIMKEYALGGYVATFTGSGSDYPLQPGKSVVIASQALNHTAETTPMYTPDVDGAMISPVDLSHADYEICLKEFKPAVSLDNPDVPNMTVIRVNGSQNYFMLPYTGNAIIFAKLPAGTNLVDYANDDKNYKERPDGSYAGQKYLMIPQEYVLDGLNIVNNADKPDQQIIRLRAEVDAGTVFMAKAYGGKSIRRKVERMSEDGRAILKDTNNSTEDFLRDQNPTPGIIPTTVD